MEYIQTALLHFYSKGILELHEQRLEADHSRIYGHSHAETWGNCRANI